MTAHAPLREAAGVGLLTAWLLVTASWWALALAPVAEPPVWLALARSVCFGSTPTGLPDTYGWLLLTAAPGSMLLGILATWGSGIAAALRSTRRQALGRAAVALAGGLMVAGMGWSAMRVAEGLARANTSYAPEASDPLPPTYPRLDLATPDFALVDQRGGPFTPEALRGRVTLMSFAFAHCHTVCPVIATTLRRTAQRLGDAAPQIVVVTLDPWRDTPSRLEQMRIDWDLPAGARVLSGDVAAVTAALDAFKVPRQRNEEDGDVAHPALVYVIDAAGRIAYGFNNPTVDWLVEAASRLAADAPARAS